MINKFKKFGCALLAALALAVGSSPVYIATVATPQVAPPPCAPIQFHARYLYDKYGEVPMPRLVDAANNRILDLFVNPEKATWTLFVTNAGQLSCFSASGIAVMPAYIKIPEQDGDPT